MQKRLRYAQLAALLAGLAVAACALLATRALPAQSQTQHLPSASRLIVIQGHVTAVDNDSITILTPEMRPTPVPGRPTPMFIRAGDRFEVDTSHANFDTPYGVPNAPHNLKVGDAVVIVCNDIQRVVGTGRKGPAWPVTADIVEKLEIPLAQ